MKKMAIIGIGMLSMMLINFIYLASSQEYGANHPNMYLDIDDIEEIKSKLNQEPWKSAYQQLISNADTALSVTPPSVTYKGRIHSSGDKHLYWTEPAYSSDGVYNPNSDREDYYSAILVGKSVRDLGLAYALTGDSKYANKAIQFIRIWAINSDTRMSPVFTNEYVSWIELSITIPGIFYGADLIWNYPEFSSADKDAFKIWTQDLIDSAKGWSTENNVENWRLVLISSGSVIAEDSNSRNYAFDRWKAIISDQMTMEGKMKYEITRTRSLSYSTYAINAMVQTAEIARHYGIDLYNYKLSDGRGLEKALDFHAPYVANPSSWPYQQITTYQGDNVAIYELAHSFKEKDSYMDAIERWGRPMNEIRILGPVTLTHANAYFNIERVAPTEPNPVIIPGSTIPGYAIPPGSAIPNATSYSRQKAVIHCYVIRIDGTIDNCY